MCPQQGDLAYTHRPLGITTEPEAGNLPNFSMSKAHQASEGGSSHESAKIRVTSQTFMRSTEVHPEVCLQLSPVNHRNDLDCLSATLINEPKKKAGKPEVYCPFKFFFPFFLFCHHIFFTHLQRTCPPLRSITFEVGIPIGNPLLCTFIEES